MLDSKIINEKIVKQLFLDSEKLIIKIDKDMKILDSNDEFNKLNLKFKYLYELITYTHIEEFKNKINSLNQTNDICKFSTNFSFEKDDVGDLPSTYDIILQVLDDEEFIVVAEPKLPLSQSNAKVYLSLINDFSKTSRELTKTKQKLQYFNNNLQKEIDIAVENIRKKDNLILKQSKDAMMGAMIDSIAHQWKGPLSAIKIIADSMRMDIEIFDNLEAKTILDDSKKIDKQVMHLLETLNEFRDFFRPNVELEKRKIVDIVESVKTLLKDDLIKNKIQIFISDSSINRVSLIPNQFKHVLINLISNSKDAFLENDIKDKKIEIDIFDNNDSVILKFKDNAGGIPKDLLDKIFENNFTTKEVGKGTGVGLYLTKQILEKINAQIKVSSYQGGSIFEITFS